LGCGVVWSPPHPKTPNPQSPIPNPQTNEIEIKLNKLININFLYIIFSKKH